MAYMDRLQAMNQINIKEKANWIEAATALLGQEVEMANIYNVKDESGKTQFRAVEQTGCIARQMKQCMPDCAPWHMDMFYIGDGSNERVFSFNRDCSCTFLCCNRPSLDIIDGSDNVIGTLVNPWTICNYTIQVDDKYTVSAGCCQLGLWMPLPCGPCSRVTFDITDNKSGQNVGSMQKEIPGCCTFFLAPDVDNYNIDVAAVADPHDKVLLLAAALFTDMRWFNDNPNDNADGSKDDRSGE